MIKKAEVAAIMVLAGCVAVANAQRRLGTGLGGATLPVRYEDLEPFANVVDVRGMWKLAGLPDPPKLMCHVGLLGWHCHNTTMQPWNPKSILPKDQAPPMPDNATCIICPRGWQGPRGNLVEMLLDLPAYVTSRGTNLPPGMWDGQKLLQAMQAAQAAANATANATA